MTITAKSTTKTTRGPVPAYAISKTALNMINMQWAVALKEEGFIVTIICPGVGIPFMPQRIDR
jgi:NAD(P)-dependent dehydrogenase (short-subunit alcohol dehydrogenase family)